MKKYVVLVRGINVGGKNKMPMAILKECLQELGLKNVVTYIASGNVILESDKPPTYIKNTIETALPKNFTLDSALIKVLVLSHDQLTAVVKNKPATFGDEPTKYHSDAIFLIGISTKDAMSAFHPREGVDKIWAGDGVIYSQRLSSERTKSRLGKITESPHYKSMTIRNWNTTTKLLELLESRNKN